MSTQTQIRRQPIFLSILITQEKNQNMNWSVYCVQTMNQWSQQKQKNYPW